MRDVIEHVHNEAGYGSPAISCVGSGGQPI